MVSHANKDSDLCSSSISWESDIVMSSKSPYKVMMSDAIS